VILLIAQIAAHQAIFATITILEEHAVCAVFTILQVRAPVTLHAIDAFVAQLRLAGAETVHTVMTLVDAVGVVAIPIFVGIKDEITILVFAGMIGVLAVFIELEAGKEARPRDDGEKLMKLWKERARKIHLPAIGKRIPLVAVPLLLSEHLARRAGVDIGNDIHPGKIACALVEIELIALRKPPLKPTVRTERGRRDGLFLSGNNGRELIDESEIVIGDLEGLLAPRIAAGELHGNEVYSTQYKVRSMRKT
jgi:hypothetical protein